MKVDEIDKIIKDANTSKELKQVLEKRKQILANDKIVKK